MEVTISHNVEIKGAKITDMAALRQAVAELAKEGANISLDEKATNFRTYMGQDTKCDGAIIMGEGRHDIGLVKQADGSFVPRFDPYGFGRSLLVEADATNFQPNPTSMYDENNATRSIGKLLQRYNVCRVEREAAMRGQSFTRTTSKGGVIELEISVN